MGTRNTAAQVHGIARVYQLRYRTRTRKTCDLIPVGFAVPVTNATDRQLTLLCLLSALSALLYLHLDLRGVSK